MIRVIFRLTMEQLVSKKHCRQKHCRHQDGFLVRNSAGLVLSCCGAKEGTLCLCCAQWRVTYEPRHRTKIIWIHGVYPQPWQNLPLLFPTLLKVEHVQIIFCSFCAQSTATTIQSLKDGALPYLPPALVKLVMCYLSDEGMKWKCF